MLAMGDTAKALAALEESTARSGGAWTIFIPLMDAAFDGVRESSRVRELLRKAKMDEKILVSPNGGRGI